MKFSSNKTRTFSKVQKILAADPKTAAFLLSNRQYSSLKSTADPASLFTGVHPTPFAIYYSLTLNYIGALPHGHCEKGEETQRFR